MVPEGRLEQTGQGMVPTGDGWYVLNARDAQWIDRKGRGAYCDFEGELDFPQLGVNLQVLGPGQPMAMYHREVDQEDFLVLAGECLLLIEGEERHLKQWDFVHCPPWTEHVFVGAGSGPCALLAVGGRSGRKVVYPASELAQRHGAGVAVETDDPQVAYAENQPDAEAAFRDGWLPG
jgi:uncharacterized cupin superfamily protein